ncbi:MAG: YggS family pyridoxal phosphate-dependent enzyme, partial [Pelagibacteraceae bacterium]
MNIVQNFKDVQKDLNNLNLNSKIIAVSKTFELSHIMPLIDDGHLIYGENRVQEAKKKWSEILISRQNLELHLIGGLQSNKAKDAVKLFQYIHSVD